MTTTAIFAFLAILLAGFMNGSFAVPMKWTQRWAWENIWFAWSLIGLVVFPRLMITFTIPDSTELYRQSAGAIVLLVFLSGVAWGASQVLFGLGINRVGMALGFAIVVGLAALVGSLIPIVMLRRNDSSQLSWQLAAGILIVLSGVSLCSYAGSLRSGARRETDASGAAASKILSGSNIWMGILLCIFAGVGGAMINVGMVAGAPFAQLAASHNIPLSQQTDLIWVPLLGAGFLTIAVYCGALLIRNGTWRRFAAPGSFSHWLLATIMAVCWFGSVELYGMSVGKLGSLGPVLGWPVFLSCSIVSANVWGFAIGEWRHVSGRPFQFMLTGLGLLVVAMFVIGSVHS